MLKPPTMSAPTELRVEVLGNDIIVILPATSYKTFVSKIDAGAPMTHVEFLAKAWLAANVKARELGWIA